VKGEEGVKNESENLLHKMFLGSVCAQMVRCGKLNCKCARGELHGPYYYHFSRLGGTLIKRYIPASDVEQVRAACLAWRNHKQRVRLLTKMNHRQISLLRDLLRENEGSLTKLLE